jgi:glycosyltransferase involved in cell wall biosynthesis
MVKNEELFIGAALKAVREFADHVIVIDTGSTDRTEDRAVSALNGRVSYTIQHEPDLRKTHRHVVPYVGTDTWVFGVDGDEIYDPEGLRRVRGVIETGALDSCWQCKGMYFHVTDMNTRFAIGHFGPPSWNPTKLYNFANIVEWPEDGERTLFHCKTRVVKPAAAKSHDVADWEVSDLRCLHMRHLQGDRLNPEDLIGHGSASDRGGEKGKNKRRSYRMGPIQHIKLDAFKGVLSGTLVE